MGIRSTDTAAPPQMKARVKKLSVRPPSGVSGRVTRRDEIARGALLVAALALAACGRSDLDLGQPVLVLPAVDAGLDVAIDVAFDADLDERIEQPFDRASDPPLEAPPEGPPVPVCRPQPETCNGVDDDCDGQVDQDLPAIPCPAGGNRYCVSGRYSECPRRCEVCVPGSQRECFTSFCTFWGTQACTSDGRSFGPCKETMPPAGCKRIADRSMKSPELEQCCLDEGLCCLDEFDLDRDGDRTEMLGRCDSVMCEP